MKLKIKRSLAIGTILAVSTLITAPLASAVDPVTTGTIHVLSRVVNDNLGTKYPTDFTFNLKHWGTDVVGSPFIGAGNLGTTFVVEPGSYVVSTPVIEGYNGVWYNGVITNGFIDLQAGDEVTIVRISDDVGIADVVVVDEPTTEDGGLLPNTATPLFNYLLIGTLVAAAGALGLRKSISLRNTK